MKHFSELEKDIIRQIYNMSAINEENGLNVLFNIFSDFLSKNEVYICDHKFIYNESSLDKYGITQIVTELGKIIYFIKELKDKCYVTIIDINMDGVDWDDEIATHENNDSLNGSMGIWTVRTKFLIILDCS